MNITIKPLLMGLVLLVAGFALGRLSSDPAATDLQVLPIDDEADVLGVHAGEVDAHDRGALSLVDVDRRAEGIPATRQLHPGAEGALERAVHLLLEGRQLARDLPDQDIH